MSFSLSFRERTLTVSHPGSGFSTVAGGDFFRLHLDTGEHHELEAVSSAQVPSAIEELRGGYRITYREILAEDGSSYPIALTVTVRESEEGVLSFCARIQNNGEGVRVNELQLPILEAERLAGPTEEEVAYIPDGLGARYRNPREGLLASYANTEFLHADYKTVFYNAAYPHGGKANAHLSMPWYTVESGGYAFSLLKLDEVFRITTLSLGRSPLSLPDSTLTFAISHYPALTLGEESEISDCLFTVERGDWRRTSARYRAFFDRICPSPVPSSPQWVKKMTGWQRIIMKHQYGEIFFRYADLPRIYESGARYGIHTLLVFGWWRGRFDNGYPIYEPDEALGGAAELRAAIREVQARGGRVILYSNGNLIDITTYYYRTVGHRIAARDIDGNEYREHYGFSNNGTLLDRYGYKSFVTACHATDEWQENLLRVGREKLAFSPDGIFYDQLCCCHKCCFDKNHLHGKRIDLEPTYRLKNAAAIRSLLPEEGSLGTEVIADRFTPYFDYIHGCGMAMSYSAAAYPDLYRHTFPEVVISNRWAHAEEKGFLYKLNYAFVTGLVFDVSIYRGRRVDMSGAPQYAEAVSRLIALKEAYRSFFYGGRFTSVEHDLALPYRVHAAVYRHEDAAILAMCNNTGNEVTLTVLGHPLTLADGEVTVLPL